MYKGLLDTRFACLTKSLSICRKELITVKKFALVSLIALDNFNSLETRINDEFPN